MSTNESISNVVKRFSLGAMCFLVGWSSAAGGESDGRMFDLSKDKVLYCVGYAHLDTQWRWDFCTTIDRFIKDTLDQNFERFERFDGYVFNFTGSVRYRMMQEYYPDKYEELKQYIAANRWHVSGSSVDEGDVNVPSAEAIIRQVLYGNDFFRREFGKESIDYMLPDCFGFPASMPSIWAHCGLKGFSTQKLTWGSAVGIPFKIGVWEGLDGHSVIAAFDPGPYVGAIEGRVDLNPKWVERVLENGRKYGVWADYHYYGVGDQGGAPREADVANYLASIGNPDGRINVALVSSDQMFKDITREQEARLPRYRGDLLLTQHSAGTLTSQSYMKRWNRKNEILADAAERAAVAADWLGAAAYPLEKLNNSWERVLANQMHDILPGTSIPRAYTYSWNDEIVAMNGFAAVLQDSVSGIVRGMDTRVIGQPIVVYNPLVIDREDLVEATVEFDGPVPKFVRVFDRLDHEVPSQELRRGDRSVTVLFSAQVESLSLTVFDVRPGTEPFDGGNPLIVTEKSIENESYRVTLDEAGDVASILDKHTQRELLAAPAQLVFTFERPDNWPAWNMDWADRQHPPIDRVAGPAKIRVVEHGPVRVSVQVERSARNSIITQQIRLARGNAGKRVEFKSDIDWQSTECTLKASFPLTVANSHATYNWGMGTIERGNNDPTKYEVPSHEWFDLTDQSGDYGVSILEDSKFGSDKPSDNEVRLTLLYTPGVRGAYLDQHSQDWGRHDITYALYGHRGDWRDGRSEWQGRRLNQPLSAFQARPHAGHLGSVFSLASVNTEQVDMRAVKRAEHADRIIVRLQELWGRRSEGVQMAFHAPVADAYEVDGQERRIAEAAVVDGKLHVDMAAYNPRSFSVLLAPSQERLAPATCSVIEVPFNEDVVSSDAGRSDGAFGSDGRSIPAEMLPHRIESGGIVFELGSTAAGRKNALACAGQTIALGRGEQGRLYLLAAATEDTDGVFLVDGKAYKLNIQKWTGFVGQWDDRVWDREFAEVDHRCEGRVEAIRPGFIKRDTIAWFCTHRHHPERGNEPYKFSYLFKYGLDLPPGAETVTLPNNEKIKILAMTFARNANAAVHAAAPLYDDFRDREPVEFRHVYPPPPTPVFDGATPIARAVLDRTETPGSLAIGPPVDDDYADQASGHGVVFRFFDGGGAYRPHSQSGYVGDTLPRLNDGSAARNDDDTKRCVWFNSEGRFYVDLGRSLPLARINTYSWHRGNRAPQFFSVWGSNDERMPSAAITAGAHEGWTLIAVVNTKELGDGGAHGSSVSNDGKRMGPFRHLLWVAQDMGQGTFFTEVDVHAAP